MEKSANTTTSAYLTMVNNEAEQQLKRASSSSSLSNHNLKRKGGEEKELTMKDFTSLFTEMTTILGFAMLILFGHMRDLFGKITGKTRYWNELMPEDTEMAPLVYGWENFYTRRLFNRIQDCWNRPIDSYPGAHIHLMERVSTDNQKTMVLIHGRGKTILNLGSYNYLGFADDWEPTCGKGVRKTLEEYGTSTCSTAVEGGYTQIHKDLEKMVAEFVGKEDAVVFGMGFGTNAWNIPSLVGEGCLIISDELNHTSIVNGCRAAGARTRTFTHNSPESLDHALRDSIAEGQPGNHTYVKWDKILVVVEGIYSMEGAICKLRQIVKVCKKYKAYIFVDEAHSIGAIGKSGKGVCDQQGVNPKDIDILMGTFTKSFGGMGGYICASKEICDHIRSNSRGPIYTTTLSPVVARQVMEAFNVIQGKDGTNLGREKLDSIRDNANYFRTELKKMGCGVLGDNDSPIIPVLLYHPTKIAAFSRECLARGLGVVVVGFPAVPLYGARARFCISAAHKKEDLKAALKSIKEVVKLLNLRYGKSALG